MDPYPPAPRPDPQHDHPDASAAVLDLVACPECHLPAEVVDRDVWESTEGPVEHARVRCVARHVLTLPSDRLASLAASLARPTTGTERPRPGGHPPTRRAA